MEVFKVDFHERWNEFEEDEKWNDLNKWSHFLSEIDGIKVTNVSIEDEQISFIFVSYLDSFDVVALTNECVDCGVNIVQ